MERAILERTFQDNRVTFGKLTLPWTWNGQDFTSCLTLELPWNNNEPNVSCIPEGIYSLRPVYSRTFGSILAIEGIPGRSLVRVHAGNHTGHTHGCVLTGKAIGTVKGRPFIFSSRDALSAVVAAVQAVYDRQEECEIEVCYA